MECADLLLLITVYGILFLYELGIQNCVRNSILQTIFYHYITVQVSEYSYDR